MLRSIVSSIAPLFSNMGGVTRTGTQGKGTSNAGKVTSVEAMKVYGPFVPPRGTTPFLTFFYSATNPALSVAATLRKSLLMRSDLTSKNVWKAGTCKTSRMPKLKA